MVSAKTGAELEGLVREFAKPHLVLGSKDEATVQMLADTSAAFL